LNKALSLDSKLSSHPIEVDCPDASHINQVSLSTILQNGISDCLFQIFDALSYSKAASGGSSNALARNIFAKMFLLVLRMLSNYVGEDLFLKGVSLYLKEKLYANSVTNDLWRGISKSTGNTGILHSRNLT
jgi:aminopeptidase 2